MYQIVISLLPHPKQEHSLKSIPDKTHEKQWQFCPQRGLRKLQMNCFSIQIPHVQLSVSFAVLCKTSHKSIDGSDSLESIILILTEALEGS